MPVGHLYVFFAEMSSAHFPILCLFFLLLLSYISCLYILDIKPLSVAMFAKIFFHSVCCLLTFLMVSFAMQKLLSLLGPIGLFVPLLPLF